MDAQLQWFAVQQAAEVAKGLFLLAAAIASLAATLLVSLLVDLWRSRK